MLQVLMAEIYGYPEGIAFIGNNGTLVVNRRGWELIPETKNQDNMRMYQLDMIPKQNRRGNPLEEHAENFVKAVKANDTTMLKCSIESGSIAAINAQMGNIAYKTGRKIYWDKENGNFKNDEAANKLIAPVYHNKWKLPKI